VETIDLATRLQEARAAEEPLRGRLNAAEAALRDALDRNDYGAAGEAQQAIEPARQELAIASATTTALEQAAGVIAQQRQADLSAIQDQQRRDQAHTLREQAVQRERDAVEEGHRLLAAAHAGIAAVHDHLVAAVQLEYVAGQAKQEAYSAAVTLGELPGGAFVSRPNYASSPIERDELLRLIYARR
jgi:hypothetical protein